MAKKSGHSQAVKRVFSTTLCRTDIYGNSPPSQLSHCVRKLLKAIRQKLPYEEVAPFTPLQPIGGARSPSLALGDSVSRPADKVYLPSSRVHRSPLLDSAGPCSSILRR